VKVPFLVVPVRPGRNVPILIEAAAKNQRLKAMGFHAAEQMNKNLFRYIEEKEKDAG